MKKKLLTVLMATIMTIGGTCLKASASTEEQIYKEAYEASVKTSQYKFENNSAIELQKVINEARYKIKALNDLGILKNEVSTFSSIVDKQQEAIFQLMIQKNKELKENLKPAPINYLYCNQEDINFIKNLISELIKTEKFYATTFSSLSDIPQQHKITNVVNKIQVAKSSKYIGDVIDARECIDDLMKITNNQDVKKYVEDLNDQVKELEKLFPNKQVGDYHNELRVEYSTNGEIKWFTRGRTTREWSNGAKEIMDRNTIMPIFWGREKNLGEYGAVYIRFTNKNNTYCELVRLADNFVLERIYTDGKIEKFNPKGLSDVYINKFKNESNFTKGWYKPIK